MRKVYQCEFCDDVYESKKAYAECEKSHYKIEEIKELMGLFENSFINEINELILIPETNLYFKLNDVKTKEDLIYKIIAWCSRDASKAQPFDTERENEKYKALVRYKLNYFLNVGYGEAMWFELYCQYGNGTNEEECRKMIKKQFLTKG